MAGRTREGHRKDIRGAMERHRKDIRRAMERHGKDVGGALERCRVTDGRGVTRL